ncbi:uncharacterized protein E0L32_009666 [Thyridium curvatum]|uniref:Uncharacterized protein n=1 Tax=Thyridium curvatum TaxID=1093900 RepID=A0A507AVH6_9PEZI|nr:uncharacterized protein E0L32_009666 [Thyridium curvatum]TPX08848.1 hypothetical protein E0L32_009666 [Thyridium curvatum]
MLPKVDWWPIKDNVIPSELRSHPLFINATFEALYPKLVDASASLDFCNAAASRTENITAALIALCPFGGLPDILDSFQELLNIDSDRGFATNITVTAPHHVRDVSVGWKLGQGQHGESAVAYATTASDFVVKELREQGRGIKPHVQVRMKTQAVSTSYRMTEAPDGDHGTQTVLTTSGRPWRQPAVAVQCAPVREDAGRKVVQFGAGPYKAALDLTADVERLTQAHQDGEDLHFIDLTSSALGPVSASVLHRTGNSQRLCIAIARWVDSDVSSFVSSGDPPSTMVPVQPGASPEGLFLDKNEVLQMSTDWTRLLRNPVFTPTSDLQRNRTTTAFDEFYKICSKSVDSSSRCLAIGMSLYLTDALARLQYSWDTFRCDLDPLALSGGQKTSCMQHRASTEEVPVTVHLGMEEFLRVTGVSSSYFQRKSAYGLQGFSVSMAFALLIFHVVVILAHWMEHFVRKRTYRTRGWADVGELVALAMRADHFDVLAPGQSMLADGETWRLRTFVREKKSTGSADIMLKPKTTRLRSAAPNKIPPVSIWRESTICSERKASSCESLAEAKHKEMDIC